MEIPRRLARLFALTLVLVFARSQQSRATSTPFTILWTASGDDSLSGQSTSYDLRYSTRTITPANFSQATRITGLAAPAASGTPQSFVVAGLDDTVLYYLAIKSGDEWGNWSVISDVFVRPGTITEAGVTPLPPAASLSSPWPNPAGQQVRWAYSLARTSAVQLDVFDAAGRRVRAVARSIRAPGAGELSWDLRDERGHRVVAGVYFARARLGAATWTNRLIVR